MTARSTTKREAGPWQELFDAETGTTYYFNERSGESRWERPKGFDQRWLDSQDVAALTARSTKRRNAGDWTEMEDSDTGTVYYTNMHTGESQWEKPKGFDGQVRFNVSLSLCFDAVWPTVVDQHSFARSIFTSKTIILTPFPLSPPLPPCTVAF